MLNPRDIIPFAVGFATYGMLFSGLPLAGAAILVSYLELKPQGERVKAE